MASTAEEHRANRVVILDMRKLTAFCDYFIICSGNSTIHMRTVADAIQEKSKENDIEPLHAEGYNDAKWILLDYNDVVVHIFGEEEREFYNLEGLWGDAKPLRKTYKRT